MSAERDSGRLEMWVEAVSLEDETPYRLRFQVNGVVVGETSWEGDGEKHIEMDIGPGVLLEGANTLTVENVTVA